MYCRSTILPTGALFKEIGTSNATAAIRCRDGVCRALRRQGRDCGPHRRVPGPYSRLRLGLLRRRLRAGVGRERQYRFFFNNWPPEWRAYYAAQDYFPRDFIVAESRVRMRPFLWNEMDSAVFSVPGAKEFFDATRAHGWIDGFVIPIRGPGGFEGIVSLAAKRCIELEPADRAVLEMMGHPARTLSARRGFRRRTGCRSGAERPRNRMRAMGSGRQDRLEIGRLLGVTGATAHFHIEQVKKKLKVRSRVQAVAILTLHGVI